MTAPRSLRKGRHTDTVIGLLAIVGLAVFLFVCLVVGTGRLG